MIDRLIRDWREIRTLPRIRIHLDLAGTEHNDPFYRRLVEDFFARAHRRHRKFPLLRELQVGVAVLHLPADFKTYLMTIDASARRNIKKASRLGYRFSRIDYNAHLEDVAAIRCSTPVRQGPMSQAFLETKPSPIMDPPSRTNIHDYPYFGVLRDDTLVAYAGCLVAGELLMIGTIFGHDRFKSDNVVPFLIAGMAEYALTNYPSVRYYAYDKYYGADVGLRRFKKKFGFLPHYVDWSL